MNTSVYTALPGLVKPAMAKEQMKYVVKELDASTPAEIVIKVSRIWNIHALEIFTRSRVREITEARQVSMYLTLKKFNYSLHETGKLFTRDHATVLHSKRKVEDLFDVDRDFRVKVMALLDKL